MWPVQGDPVPAPRERRELSSEHLARAATAWWGLLDLYVDTGRGGQVKVRDQRRRSSSMAALWPLSQVLAAGLHMARLTGDLGAVPALFDAVERHRLRRGDGYLPFPGQGPLYFDDNAWVGLDQVQAVVLGLGDVEAARAAATRTLGVVFAGQEPDGGVRWRDDRASPRNTCATAPGIELALRLALIEPAGPTRDRDVEAADGAAAFLQRRLRRDDALYADHVASDGRVDHGLFAYNQGTPVGAGVLWWRLTGDEAWLDSSMDTALASLRHFAGRRLWEHPPVFVAIWFRNLLCLHAARPVPGLLDALDDYLYAVWELARDPETQALDGGGIGRYDRGGVIDHAGLVQLYALRGWPETAWVDIC